MGGACSSWTYTVSKNLLTSESEIRGWLSLADVCASANYVVMGPAT